MKILKKLGRIFITLTEEERYIAPESIKAVLFIKLKGDLHFEKTLDAVKKRFFLSKVKDISSDTIIGIIKRLWETREEQFSMVIVLSLNPIIIFFVNLWFHCYLLIYNKFDQCFLIRKKTLYELLAGRRGVDKGALDWKISKTRLSFARFIALISLLPVFIIKRMYQSIKLIIYIFLNLLFIFLRKGFYKMRPLKKHQRS